MQDNATCTHTHTHTHEPLTAYNEVSEVMGFGDKLLNQVRERQILGLPSSAD